MTVLYKNGPHDTVVDPKSLTEQEHLESTDINKMVRAAARGLQVRGGGQGVYGYDDTTMDGVKFRIEKERLETELGIIAKEHEFTEEELKAIPEELQKKFQFKKKAKTNDDKTTKETPKEQETETLSNTQEPVKN